MKLHKYTLLVSEGDLAFVPGLKNKQNRLYFERKALLGYGLDKEKKFDFFSIEDWAIKEGEEVISKKRVEDVEYFGAVDIPDFLVNKIVSNEEGIIKLEKDLEKDLATLIEKTEVL